MRSGNTTQTIMRDVLIALTPASIFGIVNFGLDALLRIVIGIVTCVACEALYQYFMHKKVTVTDLSAAVTGLLIALNIPSTLNVGFEIVGCVFAIIVVKQLFGGLGQNFMNPADVKSPLRYASTAASASPSAPEYTSIPASESAVTAPLPIPPHIRTSTSLSLRTAANAL